MNKDTGGTIEFGENWLKESLLACLLASFIILMRVVLFMGEVRAKLNRGAIV